jgi:hypothetical protein
MNTNSQSGYLMINLRVPLFAALTVLSYIAPANAEMTLIMAEEQGCFWCELWNEEIGKIYPLTNEGVAAPLRRIDVHDPIPLDLTLKSSPHFTPTFILVDNGVEVSRIEGYPGEGFFWGLLGLMLQEASDLQDSSG